MRHSVESYLKDAMSDIEDAVAKAEEMQEAIDNHVTTIDNLRLDLQDKENEIVELNARIFTLERELGEIQTTNSRGMGMQ